MDGERSMLGWHTVSTVVLVVAAALFWKLRIVDPAAEIDYFGNLWNIDYFTHVYPMSHRAARMLLDGELPLWNPFQLAGHPLLATVVNGVLYPLNVSYLLLPTHVAIEATIVLHLMLAGLFMHAYVRRLCATALAPLVAALAFMFSGFVAGRAVWFTPDLAACVWLPLGLLAVETILAGHDRRGVILLAVTTAMPIFAGWLQTWTYAIYALGLYTAVALVRAWGRGERPQRLLACGTLIATGILLGLTLAAPQLLPAIELQRLGPRTPGGLPLRQIVPLGATSPSALFAGAFTIQGPHPSPSYVGILALLLLPLSLLARARGPTVALWLILGASVIVAATVGSAAFQWFLHLPAVGWFRHPQRIVYLASVASAALVGLAVDALLSRVRFRARARAGAVLPVVGIAAAASAWAIAQPALHTYTWAAATLVALSALTARLRLRAALGTVLAVALVAELFVATQSRVQHPFHRPEVLTAERDVLDWITRHQGLDRTYFRIDPTAELPPDAPRTIERGPFHFGLMPKHGTLRGIYSVTDYEPLSLRRFADVFALLDPSTEVRAAILPFTGELDFDPRGPYAHLLTLLSVRFLVVHQDARAFRRMLDDGPGPWRLVFTGRNFVVYERRRSLPRAYHASRWETSPSPSDALAAIARPSFDPRRLVVVEDPAARAVAPPDGPITPATITRYTPTEVVVRASPTRPGYLVLTDTFYPGWEATVDGRAAAIVPANYLVRGVWLDAGAHTIVFTYRPASFTLGVLICATALVALAGWLGATRWRRRRYRRTTARPTQHRPARESS